MRHYTTPKTITFEGKRQKLDWKVTPNMNGFTAEFQSNLRFETEEQANEYELIFDGIDRAYIYKNGVIELFKSL